MSNKKSKIFNYLFRKAHNAKGFFGKSWNLFYIFYSQYILGVDIKSSTQIGDGFKIFHAAHGSVVSPGTIIGKNVSLRQNTTIGSKGFGGSDLAPVIGNNVIIGPNVCIIGNIRIGDGTIIGAGAVVVKDVPVNVIVAGNPARIIKYLNNVTGDNPLGS